MQIQAPLPTVCISHPGHGLANPGHPIARGFFNEQIRADRVRYRAAGHEGAHYQPIADKFLAELAELVEAGPGGYSEPAVNTVFVGTATLVESAANSGCLAADR